MNKLTAIKIKYEDGSYSEQLPVYALVENVQYNNEHVLIDILGEVEVDSKGDIQTQLNQLSNQKANLNQVVLLENNLQNQIQNLVNNKANLTDFQEAQEDLDILKNQINNIIANKQQSDIKVWRSSKIFWNHTQGNQNAYVEVTPDLGSDFEILEIRCRLDLANLGIGNYQDGVATYEIDNSNQIHIRAYWKDFWHSNDVQELLEGYAIEFVVLYSTSSVLSSNIEVEDIRVGANNVLYNTAGNAVRSQLRAKVNVPMSYGALDFGTRGQVLFTNGDGSTYWGQAGEGGGGGGVPGRDGESAFYVMIESSAGNVFRNEGVNTILIAHAYYGTTEVTDSVTRWTWKKHNADGTEDSAWTRQGGNIIVISPADVTSRAVFYCYAEYTAG